MSTLAEIERAANKLPPEQKQELIFFLAAQLRGATTQVPARQFTREQMMSWIEEDEADMESFRRSE